MASPKRTVPAMEVVSRLPLKCGHSIRLLELSRLPRPTSRDHSERYRGDQQGHVERGRGRFTMIVVHGGPGLSDHTESLSGLRRLVEDDDYDDVSDGNNAIIDRLVLYDQLGCGGSDGPDDDPELYSLRRYVDELREVVEHISQSSQMSSNGGARHSGANICILGHSWGGQLVLELLMSTSVVVPSAVRCAVISNAPLDESTYEAKQRALRDGLDRATREFYEAEEEEKARDGSVQSMIYRRLIGKRETDITGEMRGWSALDRLGLLKVPCLFITGDDDTIPFEEYRDICNIESAGDRDGAAHSTLILEGGGHGPFFGGTATDYFCAIHTFLRHYLDRTSNQSSK